MEKGGAPVCRHPGSHPTLVDRLLRLLPERLAKHVRRWTLWWLAR
jgi:hypothetical protein